MVLISPPELSMPEDIVESMRAANIQVNDCEDFYKGIGDVDIIYTTRIQEERFENKEMASKYRGKFVLNDDIYTCLLYTSDAADE